MDWINLWFVFIGLTEKKVIAIYLLLSKYFNIVLKNCFNLEFHKSWLDLEKL